MVPCPQNWSKSPHIVETESGHHTMDMDRQDSATKLQAPPDGRRPGIKEHKTRVGSFVYIELRGLTLAQKAKYMKDLDTPPAQHRKHLCVYCGSFCVDVVKHLASKKKACTMRWLGDADKSDEICSIARSIIAADVEDGCEHLSNVHADLGNGLSGLKRQVEELSTQMSGGQCQLCEEAGAIHHCDLDHYTCDDCFKGTMLASLSDGVIKDPLHCQHDVCTANGADPERSLLLMPRDKTLQTLYRQLLTKQLAAEQAKQAEEAAAAEAATPELDLALTAATNLLNHTSPCCHRILELADGCAKVLCPGCNKPVCIACFFMSGQADIDQQKREVYEHIMDSHRAGCAGVLPSPHAYPGYTDSCSRGRQPNAPQLLSYKRIH
jgi:hypothetical protein